MASVHARGPVCLRNENAVNPFGTGFSGRPGRGKKSTPLYTRKESNSAENHVGRTPSFVAFSGDRQRSPTAVPNDQRPCYKYIYIAIILQVRPNVMLLLFIVYLVCAGYRLPE